jgi:hypothetical protein
MIGDIVMDKRIFITNDGRFYRCTDYPYRSRETDFHYFLVNSAQRFARVKVNSIMIREEENLMANHVCGFCMRKILDDMKNKAHGKEEPDNG